MPLLAFHAVLSPLFVITSVHRDGLERLREVVLDDDPAVLRAVNLVVSAIHGADVAALLVRRMPLRRSFGAEAAYQRAAAKQPSLA